MKKGIFAVLLLALLVLFVGVVEGLTINTPSTTGQTLTGSFTFNVTTALATDNVTNCTFSTTADGLFADVGNWTAEQTEFNVTNNTALLTNAEDTTLTVVCNNEASSESATKVINIDNTAPTCSFSIDLDYTKFMDAQGITVTDASSDTTDLTYLYTLTDLDGKSQATSTSQNPNFNLEDFDQIGDFKLDLVITDEASLSTACSNKTIIVMGTDDDIPVISETTDTTTTAEQTKTQTYLIVGMIALFLAIVAVAGFFLIFRKKK